MRFLLLLIALNCSGATYYVDFTGGDNGNNGTSTGTPWKTLAFVTNQTYASGDSILLKRGETWNEMFSPPAGLNMTYADYGSGALPIIDSQGVRRWCMYVTGSNTVTRNLHLKNAGSDTGSNWESVNGTNTIESCYIQTNITDALVAAGTGMIIVTNCGLRGAADEALTLHGAARALVSNCTFTNNVVAINNAGSAMVMTVNDCLFENNGDGVGGGADIDALDTTIAVFNRCLFLGRSDGVSWAFFKGSVAGITTCNYCLFDSSRSDDDADPIVNILGQTVFNNCTFYGGTHGNTVVNTGGTMNMTNCIISSWWRFAFIDTGGVLNMDHCLTNSVTTGTITVNANRISGDPLFINPSTGDLRLQGGSPALNAGVYIGLTVDLAGNSVGNPPDVGAYERFGVPVNITGKSQMNGKAVLQ